MFWEDESLASASAALLWRALLLEDNLVSSHCKATLLCIRVRDTTIEYKVSQAKCSIQLLY